MGRGGGARRWQAWARRVVVATHASPQAEPVESVLMPLGIISADLADLVLCAPVLCDLARAVGGEHARLAKACSVTAAVTPAFQQLEQQVEEEEDDAHAADGKDGEEKSCLQRDSGWWCGGEWWERWERGRGGRQREGRRDWWR